MVGVTLQNLIDYTAWERQKWQQSLAERGDEVLKIPAGPHGDGRFESVGDVVRHIFSAEKRYVERLAGREMSDTSTVSATSVSALFDFGANSRRELEVYVGSLSDAEWDIVQEHRWMNKILRATPKKILTHVLMHEIRHWAQIATVLRLNGVKVEFHDFLFSPVLGGEIVDATTSA